MHVRISSDAETDLDSITSYLEPRSPKGLERMLSAIFTTMGQLEAFPLLGHVGRVESTYEIIVPRTPFILVYTIDDPYYVDIERVLHGAREYPLEGYVTFGFWN